MESPGINNARTFCDRILTFRDWPQPPEGYWQRFRRDSEQHWRTGRPPLEDW